MRNLAYGPNLARRSSILAISKIHSHNGLTNPINYAKKYIGMISTKTSREHNKIARPLGKLEHVEGITIHYQI